DCYHIHHSRNGNSKEKGAPTPLPHTEEDCPNAPSALIPGAMRQPIRIIPTFCSICFASRAGQSRKQCTVHEVLYCVKLFVPGPAGGPMPGKGECHRCFTRAALALAGAGHTPQDGVW